MGASREVLLANHIMQITHEHLNELSLIIEDTVQYACDQNTISGELAWTVVQCLAAAKLAELKES